MSTNLREFEHPIDGTGESVTAPTPSLVDVIAAALDTHHRIISQSLHQGCLCGWVGEVLGYDHAAHQARAVLAAIEQAGSVEWGVLAAGQERPYTYDSEDAASDDAKCACCTLVSRIVGPWTAVEG